MASTIERFICTSERHLLDSPGALVKQALRLLVQEFCDAFEAGPNTVVSMPHGATQLPLYQALRRMFGQDEALWFELAETLKADRHIVDFLAQAYARWIVRSYQQAGAFDD